MGNAKIKRLEDLQEIVVQIQEEKKTQTRRSRCMTRGLKSWKRNMTTPPSYYHFKERVNEYEYSLAMVMAHWDKHKVKLVHMGDKVISMGRICSLKR